MAVEEPKGDPLLEELADRYWPKLRDAMEESPEAAEAVFRLSLYRVALIWIRQQRES